MELRRKKTRPRKLTADKAAAINRKRGMVEGTSPPMDYQPPKELARAGRARGVLEHRITIRTDGGAWKPLPDATLGMVVHAAAVLGATIEIKTTPIPGWKPPRRKR